jgi:hypothetical protein
VRAAHLLLVLLLSQAVASFLWLLLGRRRALLLASMNAHERWSDLDAVCLCCGAGAAGLVDCEYCD